MGWLRDALVLFLVFGLVLGGLFIYTRAWPPAVIVESGSMMHADSEVSYGRFGTIDPGDLVLVKRVRGLDDVETQVEGGRERYGRPGDVIVYFPANDRARTPIIHRAVAYVELVGSGFDVRWSADAPCEGGATKVEREARSWCRYGSAGVLIPSVPVQGASSRINDPEPFLPLASGFITKGDNPVTNRLVDPLVGISRDAGGRGVPVPLEWIDGKGRAELPWLGLLKLALAGQPNEDDPPSAWKRIGWAYAPADLWVMLGASLFVLVVVPILIDAHSARRARRRP